MLIKYNRPNVHTLCSFDGKEAHILRPGWNEFPKRIWDLWKADAEILQLIEDKAIELMPDVKIEKQGKKQVRVAVGQDDKPLDLRDLPDARAIEVIKDTLNRDMLQRWIDVEQRSKVKRALEKQIKPLLPGGDTEEDKAS